MLVCEMKRADSMETFKKEVMEKDALNRIKWDPGLKREEFDVFYLDRISGRLSKVNFSEIELEGDFLRIGDNLIPMHRIRKIEWKGRVVWERRRG